MHRILEVYSPKPDRAERAYYGYEQDIESEQFRGSDF